MYIEKSFANSDTYQRYYSISMDEGELSLYSEFTKAIYSEDEPEVDGIYYTEEDKYKKNRYRNRLALGGGLAGAAGGYISGSNTGALAYDKAIADTSSKSLRKTNKKLYDLAKADPYTYKNAMKKRAGTSKALAGALLAAGAGAAVGHVLDNQAKKNRALNRLVKERKGKQ